MVSGVNRRLKLRRLIACFYADEIDPGEKGGKYMKEKVELLK